MVITGNTQDTGYNTGYSILKTHKQRTAARKQIARGHARTAATASHTLPHPRAPHAAWLQAHVREIIVFTNPS